jgi:hypothetical protein
MKVAPWMPEQFEFQQNYPGGQQAYEQAMHQTVQNWQNQQGGPKGPRQQNIGIMGLDVFGQGGPREVPFGTSGDPFAPPPSNPLQSPQHDFNQFGEQLTGFGETMGGFGEQLGGFSDTLGGYQEQITGFGDQFQGLNERLSKMEEGITTLLDRYKPNPQEGQLTAQPFNPYQGFNPYGGMGMNPFSMGLGSYFRGRGT